MKRHRQKNTYILEDEGSDLDLVLHVDLCGDVGGGGGHSEEGRSWRGKGEGRRDECAGCVGSEGAAEGERGVRGRTNWAREKVLSLRGIVLGGQGKEVKGQKVGDVRREYKWAELETLDSS